MDGYCNLKCLPSHYSLIPNSVLTAECRSRLFNQFDGNVKVMPQLVFQVTSSLRQNTTDILIYSTTFWQILGSIYEVVLNRAGIFWVQ